MTENPHPWDRLPAETLKAHTAFRAYIALGARRSVREAARQHHIKALSSGEICGQENTTVSTWLSWSSKHRWVSRANSRDAWLARVSDEQTAANMRKCLLALTETALKLLESGDSRDFLRASRALALHFPPVQRVADISERIEDLTDLTDDQLDRMREIRDERREMNGAARLPN